MGVSHGEMTEISQTGHSHPHTCHATNSPVASLNEELRAIVVWRSNKVHPFTEPCVRPAMMYFCTKTKPMIAGICAINTPAANEPQFSSKLVLI